MIRLKFWGVVLLQVLLLVFIVARYHYALANGVPVLLKVVPVDPRDLLRGDYVILNYEISNIKLDTVRNEAGSVGYGDTVYVRLEKGEKYWEAMAIDKTIHPTDTSNVWLRGRVESSYRRNLRIKYGIEQFFIPEGTGHLIERERNREKVSVEIRVSKSGIGLIKQLYVSNQPVSYR